MEAPGAGLCRAWRAGRGVPGEAGPVASRAGGEGVEETAPRDGPRHSPSGTGGERLCSAARVRAASSRVPVVRRRQRARGVQAAWGVLEQHAAVRVHVRVGVLGLAVIREHARHDLVHRVDELEELVVGHVLQSELALAGVPRVGLAQHGVAVAGDDLFKANTVYESQGTSHESQVTSHKSQSRRCTR